MEEDEKEQGAPDQEARRKMCESVTHHRPE
jgi:hypothetical protein